MAIHTDNINGYAQEDLILDRENDEHELFEKIKDILPDALSERNIPFNIYEDVVKSGSFFRGSRSPVVIISHPDPSCKYFSIGICVNGNQISFPLVGRSEETRKVKMKQMYEHQGSIKALLIKPDTLKLQKEENWRRQVILCFNSLVD